MKRVIRCAGGVVNSNGLTGVQMASAEKLIRQIIYSIWTTVPGGNPVGETIYYSDPRLLCNITEREFVDSGQSGLFSDYVFNHREDLFDADVAARIDALNKPEAYKDHMIKYYNGLTQADYNRNLFLKRTDAKLGIKK